MSWSWKSESTSAAPMPTSFIRIRWSGGTLKFGDAPCEAPDSLEIQPIVTVSPRWYPNSRAVFESRTNSSGFLGLAALPWVTTTRSSLKYKPFTLPFAPTPSAAGNGSPFLVSGPALIPTTDATPFTWGRWAILRSSAGL